MKERVLTIIKKLVFVVLLVGTCLFSSSFMAQKTEAAEIPSYIYAVYSGGTVIIGEEIDLDLLSVYAVYASGATDTVTDYVLSSYKATSTGANVITVVYLGKTYSFVVIGKALSNITSIYTGSSIQLGDSIDTRELLVYLIYTDGTMEETKEYTLPDPVVTTLGLTQKAVVYGSKSTNVNVYGVAAKTVSQLFANYTGAGVMVDCEIDKEDLYITALYSDGTSSLVSNYTMSISKAQVVGDNTITIAYKGIKTTVNVTGLEKTISSISAVYTGDTVEVGSYVRLYDITVTVVYADGSKEKVTDFTLPNPEIYYVGTHTKTVYYQDFSDTITVIGVEEKEANYDNAATFDATDGYVDIYGELAVPEYSDASEIEFDSVDTDLLTRLMRRVAKGKRYVAFEIDFSGDIEDDFPMEMTLDMPEGYNVENCTLYYTPNRRTVIALLNYEADTTNNAMICEVYNPGTYVLVYGNE